MTRPTRRASRFLAGIGVGAIAVALGLVVAAPAHAATIVATDAASLSAAITLANDPVLSPGPDIISIEPALPGNTITMSAANPQITSQITIVGDASNPPTIVGPTVAAPIFQVVDATDDFEVDHVKMAGIPATGSAITFVSSSGAVKLIGDTFTNFPHPAVEFLLQTGPITITDSTFSHNSSLVADADGGAISAGSVGDVTITGSTFDHNTANHHGGAIYLGVAHSVNISGSTFDSNTAIDDAGAIEVTSLAADSTWTGNTFTGNSVTASTTSLGGAAFYLSQLLTNTTFIIDKSTFSGNTAAAKAIPTAGAVGFLGTIEGTVQVLDSTMTGNRFTNLGPGAGGRGIDLGFVSIDLTGEVDLAQSTFDEAAVAGDNLLYAQTNAGLLRIASNTLTGPGVVQVDTNSNAAANAVEIRDSIAISNSALDAFDVTGTPAEIGYSITSDAANAQLIALTGNLFSVTDAQIGALANNGGATNTRLPLAGSPAIDAGDPGFTTPVTDQRGAGFARIVNGRVDIGAVEVPAATATTPTLAATGVSPTPTVWTASTALAAGLLLLGAAMLMRRARRNTAK